MNKVKELMSQIQEIEDSITEEMSKEELYDKLVVAYSHAKDIITITQANIPLKEDNPLEAPLRDAQDALLKAESLAVGLQLELDTITSKYEAAVSTLTQIESLINQ